MSHLFFLIALKSGIMLVRSFSKLNQQLNLKRKFLVLSEPKYTHQVFKIPEANGIKLMKRLKLNFSYLNKHKFWHNIRATIDPMCSCGPEPRTTLYYFLRCNLCSEIRIEVLNDNCTLNPTLKTSSHGSCPRIFKKSKKVAK